MEDRPFFYEFLERTEMGKISCRVLTTLCADTKCPNIDFWLSKRRNPTEARDVICD
jgi:hypothetical protein